MRSSFKVPVDSNAKPVLFNNKEISSHLAAPIPKIKKDGAVKSSRRSKVQKTFADYDDYLMRYATNDDDTNITFEMEKYNMNLSLTEDEKLSKVQVWNKIQAMEEKEKKVEEL